MQASGFSTYGAAGGAPGGYAASGYGVNNAAQGGYGGYDGYGNNAAQGGSQHSIFRSGPLKGGQMRKRASVHPLEFCFAPWLCLVLILTCFLLAGSTGHNVFFIVWVIPLLMLGLCGIFVYTQYQKGRNEEVWLGLLCFVAVMASLVVGAYAHTTSLKEFWRLGQGASYFNVVPSELAAGKSDASSLVFTNSTRVDTTKTYGLVDGHSANGDVYCVAPVSTGDFTFETRVQYWAAGVDCCFPRSDFHCSQAANPDAHGALVLRAGERSNPLWKNAVNGAQKAYGIQAGDDYLLVKWIVDPVGYREKLWRSAWTLFVIFAGVYLLISGIAAFALWQAFKQ